MPVFQKIQGITSRIAALQVFFAGIPSLFQRARKLIRDALTDAGIAPRIEALVARVVGN